MIFFTSDSHFNHSRIIEYCNRPFTKTIYDEVGACLVPDVEAMNEHLIECWNSKVKKNDVVYHLGDFGFSPKAKPEGIEKLQKIANRLSGKIILIRGNHDTNIDSINRFEAVKDIHVIHTHNTRFVLCHYPMRSWQFMNHGSILLFGHCHSKLYPLHLSFDVGVDNAKKILGDYVPLSVHDVLDYAKTLQKPEWIK